MRLSTTSRSNKDKTTTTRPTIDLVKFILTTPNNSQIFSIVLPLPRKLIILTKRSFREIMRPLIARPTTLWRGTVPTILRNVPGVSIYFYTLSFLRQTLLPKATRQAHSSQYVTLVNVSAGMLARAGAGFILMPISVIKVRFESNLYNYGSLAQASKDIFQREGFRGFFSGFGATALRDAPYAGIHLALYEGTKTLIGGIPFIHSLLVPPLFLITCALSVLQMKWGTNSSVTIKLSLIRTITKYSLRRNSRSPSNKYNATLRHD